MAIKEQGFTGEWLTGGILLKKGFKWIQVDGFFEYKGEYWFIETKYKERFTAGSNFMYDSQGLNLRELKKQLEFEKKTGIKVIFLCLEPDGKEGFKNAKWQFLKTLEELPDEMKFDTGGIRLYPLKFFRDLEELEKLKDE